MKDKKKIKVDYEMKKDFLSSRNVLFKWELNGTSLFYYNGSRSITIYNLINYESKVTSDWGSAILHRREEFLQKKHKQLKVNYSIYDLLLAINIGG